ncbi:unnamed protein product [Diabrotica balteata]|uniref:THAP-type domain-containing protein n=1 Tax=Diabrotica balteata TaxID=107213 RepID=A0A9N9XKX2_DIABA|nr:unnamed protein product [Diabrotica balteata]
MDEKIMSADSNVKQLLTQYIANMPMVCFVVGCSNRSNRNPMGYFRIPTVPFKRFRPDEETIRSVQQRRDKWIQALKRTDLTNRQLNNARVCSNHCISGKPSSVEDILNPDWVPNINMGYASSSHRAVCCNIERYKRSIRKQMAEDTDPKEVIAPDNNSVDKNTQTEITMEKLTEDFLKLAIIEQADHINKTALNFKNLCGNDTKTRYLLLKMKSIKFSVPTTGKKSAKIISHLKKAPNSDQFISDISTIEFVEGDMNNHCPLQYSEFENKASCSSTPVIKNSKYEDISEESDSEHECLSENENASDNNSDVEKIPEVVISELNRIIEEGSDCYATTNFNKIDKKIMSADSNVKQLLTQYIANMPMVCFVVGCSNRSNRNPIRYFRIPTVPVKRFRQDEETIRSVQQRRDKWIQALKRTDLTNRQLNNARVCSNHFISGKPSSVEDILNPDWVPNINMGYASSSHRAVCCNIERYKRSIRKQMAEDTDPEEVIAPDNNSVDKNTQTEITMEKLTEDFLKLAIIEQADHINKTALNFKNLCGNDTKTRYLLLKMKSIKFSVPTTGKKSAKIISHLKKAPNSDQFISDISTIEFVEGDMNNHCPLQYSEFENKASCSSTPVIKNSKYEDISEESDSEHECLSENENASDNNSDVEKIPEVVISELNRIIEEGSDCNTTTDFNKIDKKIMSADSNVKQLLTQYIANMPMVCFVVGCSNRSNRNPMGYFRIPTVPFKRFRQDEETIRSVQQRRDKWIQALKRTDLTNRQLNNARVCSNHFISGKPSSVEDILNPDWVPNINMGYASSSHRAVCCNIERYKRSIRKQMAEDTDPEEVIAPDNNSVDKNTQTEITMEKLTEDFLKLAIIEQADHINKTALNFKNLCGNDTKTRYLLLKMKSIKFSVPTTGKKSAKIISHLKKAPNSDQFVSDISTIEFMEGDMNSHCPLQYSEFENKASCSSTPVIKNSKYEDISEESDSEHECLSENENASDNNSDVEKIPEVVISELNRIIEEGSDCNTTTDFNKIDKKIMSADSNVKQLLTQYIANMPMVCFVVGCSNRSNRNPMGYFRIPTVPVKRFRQDEETIRSVQQRRDKWMKALKRTDLTNRQLNNARVCSNHFISGKPSSVEDILNPDWVPNINMGYASSSHRAVCCNIERYKRSIRKQMAEDTDPKEVIAPDNNSVDKNTQTEITMEKLTEDFLKLAIIEQADHINKTALNFKNLCGNDTKTRYLLKLPLVRVNEINSVQSVQLKMKSIKFSVTTTGKKSAKIISHLKKAPNSDQFISDISTIEFMEGDMNNHCPLQYSEFENKSSCSSTPVIKNSKYEDISEESDSEHECLSENENASDNNSDVEKIPEVVISELNRIIEEGSDCNATTDFNKIDKKIMSADSNVKQLLTQYIANMPMVCFVVGCSNRSNRNPIRYFRIPTVPVKRFRQDEETIRSVQQRRDKWIQALKRTDLTNRQLNNARVCSNHFISGKPSSVEDILNPDWVPNINMGYASSSHRAVCCNIERYKRSIRKQMAEDTDPEEVIAPDNNSVDKNTQTEITMEKLTEDFLKLAIIEQADHINKTALNFKNLCGDMNNHCPLQYSEFENKASCSSTPVIKNSKYEDISEESDSEHECLSENENASDNNSDVEKIPEVVISELNRIIEEGSDCNATTDFNKIDKKIMSADSNVKQLLTQYIANMPMVCFVVGCSNRSNRNPIRYFRIPTVPVKRFRQDEETIRSVQQRRDKWIQALKRTDLTNRQLNNARVCSNHFISGKPSSVEDILNPDWVPNINMGYASSSHRAVCCNIERYKRSIRKQMAEDTDPEEVIAPDNNSVDKNTQTEITMEKLTEDFLKLAIIEQADHINKTALNFKNLCGNDTKTRYLLVNEKTSIDIGIAENENGKEMNNPENNGGFNVSQSTTRKSVKRQNESMATEAYNVMKSLQVKTQARDGFSIYGEHVSCKLRKLATSYSQITF